MKHQIRIRNLEALPEAALAFRDLVEDCAVIAFSGDMGAGKTTFIQALCKVYGVPGEVVSPTFALVNEYYTSEGKLLYHFDLYRIEDEEELYDMGYEEYFYSGERCLVEWPEKAARLIPDDALMVHLSVLENGSRELKFELPASRQA